MNREPRSVPESAPCLTGLVVLGHLARDELKWSVGVISYDGAIPKVFGLIHSLVGL